MSGARLFAGAVAMLLCVPVGAATWFSGKGDYEPNTLLDVQDGTMFGDADTAEAGLQVYFNVYGEAYVTAFNPNNELLGSRIYSSPVSTHHAYLGVWKDCNDDGYIGAANGALHTYRSELNVLCIDGSAFNRGGWVYEFQWIGDGSRFNNGNYPAADDQRWINDTESLIWGDLGLPGQVGAAGTCTISPPPRGTTASTGGFLNYVDCWVTGRRIAETVNTVDGDGSLGLRFDDTSNPHRSDSALNQHPPANLFGDPYAGEENDEWKTGLLQKNSQKRCSAHYDPDGCTYDPEDTDKAFHAWDCSDTEAIRVDAPATVEDPTAGQVAPDGVLVEEGDALFTSAMPSPGVDDPTGSYYDGLNETDQACDREGDTTVEAYPGSPEGGAAAGTDNARGRAQHTFFFQFSLGQQLARGRCRTEVVSINNNCNLRQTDPRDNQTTLFAFNYEDEVENRTGSDTGEHKNATLGQGYSSMIDIAGFLPPRPDWIGLPNLVNTGSTVAADIDRGDVGGAGPTRETFYARIGAATTGMGAVTAANNVARLYGDEWCHGATSGVQGGFDCDASHWWNPEAGSSAMPLQGGRSIGAKAGYAYHLRDFDCYDATLVRGSGVEASLVDLSDGGPCVDAP